MVRESPSEPSPPDLDNTFEARRARPYGMQFTAAIVVIAVVIFGWFLMR